MLINAIGRHRRYSSSLSLLTLLIQSKPARSLRRWAQFPSLRRSFVSAHSSSRFPLQDLQSISEHSSPLVFRSTSVNPYHNLAIEDYLLRNTCNSSHILLLYINRPCVVIGRNQNPWLECDLRLIQQGLRPRESEPNAKQDGSWANGRVPIDLVRRRSGGGTVFHDEGNLNYTVIVPNDTRFKRASHVEMVVRALNNINKYKFNAEIRANERNDIVMRRHGEIDWLKISGSAYKLIRGRALHHGTLLYSSPFLESISRLLRSPGRDRIRAKGVESVRSKVGNLLWQEDENVRRDVRDTILNAIEDEFRRMYGQGTAGVEVGDADVDTAGNEKIAQGARELMTDEWRFEQTPQFDFHSSMAGGFHAEDVITFYANRGVVEKLSIGTGQRGDETFEAPGLRLYTVENWDRTLQKVARDGKAGLSPRRHQELAGLLSTVFPYWKTREG